MKVVLAYSGGLDTSVILTWLQETYDAQVITFCADVGQAEELDGIDERALSCGAVKSYVDDLTEEFARDFNDVDFCLRAWEAGSRVAWTPYATFIHHEGVSLVRRSPDPRESELFSRRWGSMLPDPWYSEALHQSLGPSSAASWESCSSLVTTTMLFFGIPLAASSCAAVLPAVSYPQTITWLFRFFWMDFIRITSLNLW